MVRQAGRAGLPRRLWREVALARHRLLMLDYDGTLAPFTTERAEAYATPRAMDLVRIIAASSHTTVAIVSGRPLRDLERFVGSRGMTVVGEHGWERRAPGGEIVQAPLSPSQEALVAEAERIARAAGWAERIERKRSGVVLHTRGLDPEQAWDWEERCVVAWQPLARDRMVSIDRILGGVELRAQGTNKGTVVRTLRDEAPEGTLGVFLGDDVTDEDAFEAVAPWGFGVRVGASRATSHATAQLRSCEEVVPFLEEWTAVTDAARGESI